MIPILFGSAANSVPSTITTRGYGTLTDAVSVTITRVLNGKDVLRMTYPQNGIHAEDIKVDRTLYAQPEYKKDGQWYKIYQVTKPIKGFFTVEARHIAEERRAYLPVMPFSAGSLTECFANISTYIAESSPFTFWTDKQVTANFALTRPASLGNVLGGMEGSVLDVYGGEYEFDGYTIKLLNRRGADNGVTLRYGKNITDLEQVASIANIITGVCPFWEGMDGTVVTLPEKVIEGANADTYAFRRTVVKDFSDRFEEQPTVAQLRSAAQAYVAQSNIDVPKVDLKVSFEHLSEYTEYEGLSLLETVNLGDTIHVIYEPLDVTASARVVGTTYDCLNEKYTAIQIGHVRTNMETVVSNMTNTVKEEVKKVSTGIGAAIENATDMIAGVNGGYVVLNRDLDGKPYEILIMNTDDISTATNVIRMNQNGIGFGHAYNGPFSTAWTIDGGFVADYITSGTLNAARVKAGILSDVLAKNSWNLDTGALTITEGTINIATNAANTDKITLSYDFTNTYSGVVTKYRASMRPEGFNVWDAEMGSVTFSGFSLTKNGLMGPSYSMQGAYIPSVTLYSEALSFNGKTNYGQLNLRPEATQSAAEGLYLSDARTPTKTASLSLSGLTFTYGGTGANSISIDSQGREIRIYDSTSYNLATALNAGSLRFYDDNGEIAFINSSNVKRIQMDTSGLTFYGSGGTQTGVYPADASTFFTDNTLRTKDLAGNKSYYYSSTGSASYTLETLGLYLVAIARANNSSTAYSGLWLVSVHNSSGTANIIPILTPSNSSTTASITGNTLTVSRGATYSRVAIIRLT